MGNVLPAIAKRFWSRVNSRGPDDCWLWEGSKQSAGYGTFSFEGTAMMAHRMAYWIAFGVHPGKSHVCHKCDQPDCCNPNHLFLGSHKDNMADAANKGRAGPKGKKRKIYKQPFPEPFENVKMSKVLSEEERETNRIAENMRRSGEWL